MGRPPRSLDSLLFSPPLYDWINRVNRKLQELSALSLSDDQKLALDRWVAARFVGSVLDWDGFAVGKGEIEIALGESGALSHSAAATAVVAYREVEGFTRMHGLHAALSPDLLSRINSALVGSPAGFRGLEPDRDRIRASLELACRWFTAESFLELNPVEQAGIALLRIIEISPFEERTGQTGRIAASLFTLRAGLPPLILNKDQRPAYEAAIEEGLRISTRPMVELLAGAAERALVEMLEAATTIAR